MTVKMSFQQKVIYAFNMFYLEFLNDVKKQNDEIRKTIRSHFKVFDKSSNDHFENVKNSINNNKDDISKVELLPNMSLEQINELLGESEKKVVESYFYIFAILISIVDDSDETILETLLSIIKDIQAGKNVDDQLKEVLDDELNQYLVKLSSLLSTNSSSPSDEESNIFGMLENSQIGSLAKEISSEIDIKDLNLENPAQLLDLTNLSNSNNVLGNIISKVSTKIQDKIENGQLSQADLVNEAMSFVGMMNKNGSSDMSNIFNNPLISELLGGIGKDKNTRVQVDPTKVKNMETRERLRRKLEEKKKAGK